MARLFDDASSEYLENAATVVATVPLAMACWYNSDEGSPSLAQVLMSINDTGGGVGSFALYLSTTGTPSSIRALCLDGGGAAEASTSANYTANTWEHACGIFAANNNRVAYLNGANAGQNVVANTPANLDVTVIGSFVDGGTRRAYMSGLVAEAAIWDLTAWAGSAAARITAFEKALAGLAKGYSPLFYPLGLLAYWPLIRGLNDTVGGFNMTATGTTVASHPRVIYPSGIWVPSGEVAAPPVGNAGIMTTNTGFWGPTF